MIDPASHAGPDTSQGSTSSGFVAVVGRPNVGKSTLVNSLVGDKVSITSDKPQTTRSAILGIVEAPGKQAGLVDTPGYHNPRTLLGRRLNDIVRSAWADVDLALFVVDGESGIGRGDERVAQDLTRVGCPVFLIVNKVDRLPPARIAAALARASSLGDFTEFVPLSARTGDGVEVLRALLLEALPEGPPLYPPGTRRDQPPPVFVAELVREKLLARAREELPHSIAAVTEEYEERDDGLLDISMIVYVERPSQKGIVIGRGGETLKEVGTEAREEIEVLFGRRVYLHLRVKVEKEWQRRAHSLTRLGFDG
ncbi:GTPase Era [soil metagenome]